MAEPNTLLSRLLSRQRRRSPFSDMMGPNPLESQAVMDAAQGVDVSTPGGMSSRSAPADSGSMILASASGGGGGTPVTTAAGSGASAPVQTTAGGRFFQRSGGGCANGRCGVPQSTVMLDDGGFPVTTMASPTVVSAPTMTGMPSMPIATEEGMVQAYLQGDVGLSRLGERREQANRAYDAFNQTMAETTRVNTFNMEQERKAAALAQKEAEADIATQAVVTTGALEGTTTGQYDLIAKAKADYLTGAGGSVRDLANAIARLRGTPPMEMDGNANPVKSGEPVVTEDSFKLAFSEALGLEAVRGFLGSQYANHQMRLTPEGQASYLDTLVPRRPDEPDEDYALRRDAAKKTLFGDQIGRTVEKIVGAVQDTPEWAEKNQNAMRQRLVSDIEGHLGAGIRRRIGELNPDANPEYLDSQAIEYTQQYMDLLVTGVLTSMMDPNFNARKTWSVNERMSDRAEFWGGDKAPSEPPPADSNDTLPDDPNSVFAFPALYF